MAITLSADMMLPDWCDILMFTKVLILQKDIHL